MSKDKIGVQLFTLRDSCKDVDPFDSLKISIENMSKMGL